VRVDDEVANSTGRIGELEAELSPVQPGGCGGLGEDGVLGVGVGRRDGAAVEGGGAVGVDPAAEDGEPGRGGGGVRRPLHEVASPSWVIGQRPVGVRVSST
jgi:hypothetical protein